MSNISVVHLKKDPNNKEDDNDDGLSDFPPTLHIPSPEAMATNEEDFPILIANVTSDVPSDMAPNLPARMNYRTVNLCDMNNDEEEDNMEYDDEGKTICILFYQ
jgi:hypothetical protein